MRIPSREMPQFQDNTLIGPRGAAVMFLGILVSPGLLWWPLAFALPTLLTVEGIFSKRAGAEAEAEREGESICDFARSFDCRVVDTWIIRAVYQEFSAYASFPLRATDHWKEDLRIHDDDLNFSVEDIAKRTGRTLDKCELNPLFSSARTLGDLVHLLNLQPQVVDHATLARA